jgi:hypothetical protein
VIDLPGDKIISFQSEGDRGAQFALSGGGDLFNLQIGWGKKQFLGLGFDQSCITIEGDFRGGFDVIGGTFDSTPNPAIRTLGASVVKANIEGVMFNRCAGAVHVLHTACDNWEIKNNCQVVRASDIGVRILSSGVSVDGVKFENKFDSGDLTFPHVSIEPDGLAYAGGISEVTNCRFGGEVGTGGGPPRANIRLGAAAAASGTMTNIRLAGNRHFRRNGGGASNSHVCAIELTKDVHSSVIDDWMQADVGGTFFTALILNSSLGGTPLGNYYRARHKTDALGGIGIFSGDATGWTAF